EKTSRAHPDNPDLLRVTAGLRATLAGNRNPGASSAGVRQAGTTLDGWLLESLLGAGNWGAVYRARKGDEVRALKAPNAELARDPAFVARFRGEIKTLAQLGEHPNLVPVEDFGCDRDGCWYFTMPLIEGHNLEDHLHLTGPLPPERACFLFAALADGL